MTELATERAPNHPCETVFAAFTDPATLARWWGPRGSTNRFERFDDPAEAARVGAIVVQANEENLDRLEEMLGARHSADG